MKLTLLVGGVLVTSLGLLPSAAIASSDVATKKAPTPPVSGHWDVSNNPKFFTASAGGGLTVTAHHGYIKDLRVILAPAASTQCGTGTVHLIGKHKIIDAKGDSDFGPYNEWVVGRNDHRADPVIQPTKVTPSRGGKHFAGRFDMVFNKPRGGNSTSGNILFHTKAPGGCNLTFGIKKS
jgi:hypothetical protein